MDPEFISDKDHRSATGNLPAENPPLSPLPPTQQPETPKTFRFKLGIFFLVINIPFGLLGSLGAATLATAYPEARMFWIILGGTIYGLSWGMLGLGVLLAGKEGVQWVKIWKQNIATRWKRKNISPE